MKTFLERRESFLPLILRKEEKRIVGSVYTYYLYLQGGAEKNYCISICGGGAEASECVGRDFDLAARLFSALLDGAVTPITLGEIVQDAKNGASIP